MVTSLSLSFPTCTPEGLAPVRTKWRKGLAAASKDLSSALAPATERFSSSDLRHSL